MTEAAPAMSRVQAWKLAIRPPTLPASMAPVVAGCAVAIREDVFSFWPALAALVGAVLLQVGANFANDVADFERGADTTDRLGPPRVTQMGLLPARQVKRAMWLSFALAMAAGVYLVIVAGWPIIVMGLVSIAAAITYTGGPWPYGYRALGEVGTFVFFGLVGVVGTYYVQSETTTAAAWWWSVPAGSLVTAILVVNNLRDIETDRRAKKRTLAVIMGARATRWWYAFLVVLAFAWALAAWPAGHAGPGVLAVLVAVPIAARPLRPILGGVSGRPLNPHLKQTAQLALLVTALAVPGIVW